MKKDRKNQNSNALFIDEYGQAMSGDTYEETFKKMKKGFIEIVGQNSETLKKRLEFHSWGSHIGRHIFTNHLIKTGYLDMADGRVNATFLMVLRGDTNITTALGYIDYSCCRNCY